MAASNDDFSVEREPMADGRIMVRFTCPLAPARELAVRQILTQQKEEEATKVIPLKRR